MSISSTTNGPPYSTCMAALLFTSVSFDRSSPCPYVSQQQPQQTCSAGAALLGVASAGDEAARPDQPKRALPRWVYGTQAGGSHGWRGLRWARTRVDGGRLATCVREGCVGPRP